MTFLQIPDQCLFKISMDIIPKIKLMTLIQNEELHKDLKEKMTLLGHWDWLYYTVNTCDIKWRMA